MGNNSCKQRFMTFAILIAIFQGFFFFSVTMSVTFLGLIRIAFVHLYRQCVVSFLTKNTKRIAHFVAIQRAFQTH